MFLLTMDFKVQFFLLLLIVDANNGYLGNKVKFLWHLNYFRYYFGLWLLLDILFENSMMFHFRNVIQLGWFSFLVAKICILLIIIGFCRIFERFTSSTWMWTFYLTPLMTWNDCRRWTYDMSLQKRKWKYIFKF